jgi:hypothetical protein
LVKVEGHILIFTLMANPASQPDSIETLVETVQTRQLANRMAAAEREQERRQRPKPSRNR